MAKQPIQEKKVKIIKLFVKDGGYGYSIHEVIESSLPPAIETVQPDIFAITINQLTKKVRDLLGI